MKTTNEVQETTNKLKHVINTANMQIVISLDDDCKNGHNDFSITGTVWESGKPHTDRNMIHGGAIGDEIAKKHPRLKIFNDLHLSDAKGAPMYAVENGFYFLKTDTKEVTMSQLRITDDEYNTLLIAEDKLYFQYLLESLNIPARWELEANKAILLLEEMTGQKFEDDSRRFQFTPLSEDQTNDIILKISEGYYTNDAINERKIQAIADAKQKEFDKLVADRDKEVKQSNDEYSVKFAVLSAGMTLDSFIYYNHNNTGVFNWMKDSYRKYVTEEEFNEFMNVVDLTNLPEGIQFSRKN